MATRSKSDISRAVAKELGIPQSDVAAIMDAVLDRMVRELASGNEVRLTGYFSLGTKVHKPRNVRHPQSGEMMKVPARTKVTFSSGTKLKRWVETRLSSEHFYGQRRETDEIPREGFQMPSDDIAGALGRLGGAEASVETSTEASAEATGE